MTRLATSLVSTSSGISKDSASVAMSYSLHFPTGDCGSLKVICDGELLKSPKSVPMSVVPGSAVVPFVALVSGNMSVAGLVSTSPSILTAIISGEISRS